MHSTMSTRVGLGVRIVMEHFEVTANYLPIGKQQDRNNQLAVQYSSQYFTDKHHIKSTQNAWLREKVDLICPSIQKGYQSF